MLNLELTTLSNGVKLVGPFKWVLCTFCEKQVEILEEGMAVHGNRITAALKPLHENLEKRFKEMKSKTAPFKRVIQISFSQ